MTNAAVRGTDVAVVIPTVGRESLSDLIATIGTGDPRPSLIVVVDDRPAPAAPLVLPAVDAEVRVLRSGGRGPAAARNVGWIATDTPWVAFLDDDVRVGRHWLRWLLYDLDAAGESVGASSARIVVPEPQGRRPTDEERRTTALASAHWITADMAYRREALLATGGFDERFPRAFREDSDLALRTIRAGWTITVGQRVTEHPLRSRGGWPSSIRAQAGNADNALLRAKFGHRWRAQIGEGPGRTGRHLLAVGAAATALAATAVRRHRLAAVGAAVWAGATAEFAVRRILPGPRTAAEITTMIVTSAAIQPAALYWRVRGELRWRRPHPDRIRAVLFDRDGTLIDDVPYLADPDGVTPVATAAGAVQRVRADGIRIGVVSNQSGVSRGLIRPEELCAVNRRVEELLGPFDTWQVCQHQDSDGCSCRKPAPGLVEAAAHDLGVETRQCVLIGDIGSDVQAALRAGAQAILVPTEQTRTTEIAHARQSARVAEDLGAAVGMVLGHPG